jgi:hypothetical protein
MLTDVFLSWPGPRSGSGTSTFDFTTGDPSTISASITLSKIDGDGQAFAFIREYETRSEPGHRQVHLVEDVPVLYQISNCVRILFVLKTVDMNWAAATTAVYYYATNAPLSPGKRRRFTTESLVVYDKTNGEIVHVHRLARPVSMTFNEKRGKADAMAVAQQFSGRKTSGLAVLAVSEKDLVRAARDPVVDLKRLRLVSKR